MDRCIFNGSLGEITRFIDGLQVYVCRRLSTGEELAVKVLQGPFSS
jgi:hypothetical protein